MPSTIIAGITFLSGALLQMIFLLQSKTDKKHKRRFLISFLTITILFFSLSTIPKANFAQYSLGYLALAIILISIFFTRIFYQNILKTINEGTTLSLTISFWIIAFVHNLEATIGALGLYGFTFVLFCSALSIFESLRPHKHTKLSKKILYIWFIFVNIVIFGTAIPSLNIGNALFKGSTGAEMPPIEYLDLFLIGMFLTALISYLTLFIPLIATKKSKTESHITENIDSLFADDQITKHNLLFIVLIQAAYFSATQLLIPKIGYELMLFFFIFTPHIYIWSQKLSRVRLRK